MCDEPITYYKDQYAHLDTDTMPANRRYERCLNCNKDHKDHHGWACSLAREGLDFDDLQWDERYMTVSMRKSRGYPPKGKYAHLYASSGESVTPIQQSKDMSDWRVWARVEPGHCACNIPRHQCKYHGGARV